MNLWKDFPAYQNDHGWLKKWSQRNELLHFAYMTCIHSHPNARTPKYHQTCITVYWLKKNIIRKKVKMCCFSFQSKKSAAIESKHVEICIADFENLSTTKTIRKSKYIHEVSVWCHIECSWPDSLWLEILEHCITVHLPHCITFTPFSLLN